MKVSLNWLKDYIDLDNLSAEKIGEILTDIGLEVEGMEEVESIPGGLHGVRVGKVVECGQHPNADKLSLTKVDLGNGEPVQIVCGAPNVAAGQKVMVATVGATLYPNDAEEPLKIKKGQIRGEVSEGMICAEDELGLGDDHSGILVLPEEAEVGTTAREYFHMETDYVYEIGLTPNRSDATNHLGVAKDLAAALRINYQKSGTIHLPSVEDFSVDKRDLTVEVEVRHTEACPRYAGLSISGLRIEESPEWLKKRLRAIGLRPINNVVDVTNFVLHELGQPLHAFDLERIAQQKIIVQTLPEGTPFTTLDEVERNLAEDDLMICDGDSRGMCIAGVFGGVNTGVTAQTERIFLESAHFNAQYIRRSSMRHNLRTDAAKVFEKGSDPNVAVYALKRAALLLRELAGGQISSPIIDIYPKPIEPKEIAVRYDRINRLIGIELDPREVHQILEALEMEIRHKDEQGFRVAVPTNKADVTREADLIEEILRIYGFNQVPIPEKVSTTMAVAEQPDPSTVRNRVADYLSGNGFSEMMAVSLSESRYYREHLPGMSEDHLVRVNNTSNVHLDIMRPDMLFSALEAVLHNHNRQRSRIRLFEFGRSYQRQREDIVEKNHLSLVLTGERWPESWVFDNEKNADFYSLKAVVHNVLLRLGGQGWRESPPQHDYFAYGLQYQRGDQSLVEFGKVDGSLVKKMDIRGQVFFADFNWDALLQIARKQRVEFMPLNKFPSVRRDLALVIENSVKFGDIEAIVRKVGKKLITDINLFDVYENEEQLGAGKKSYALSLIFQDPGKTLKDKEVDKVMNKIIHQCERELSARIRS